MSDFTANNSHTGFICKMNMEYSYLIIGVAMQCLLFLRFFLMKECAKSQAHNLIMAGTHYVRVRDLIE